MLLNVEKSGEQDLERSEEGLVNMDPDLMQGLYPMTVLFAATLYRTMTTLDAPKEKRPFENIVGEGGKCWELALFFSFFRNIF